MIRKLRFKLISAAILSLLIVITIIIGLVNILNYRGITADADQILTILQNNDGHFRSKTANMIYLYIQRRAASLTAK